jgi:hypothetical protein
MFSISSISKDYISLQPVCEIVIDRPARLALPISLSLGSNIQVHFTHLMSHGALLPLIFTAFRLLDSIMSYGRSRSVIKFDKFDQSKLWESKNVEISISSKKITVLLPGNCLQQRVVSFLKQTFSVPFMSMDYISLQAPCQIFVDRSLRFG